MKKWFVNHWLVTLIAVVIIILGFAILVEVFRLCGFLPAEQVFVFLQGWATILYASVTLLLAIAAFWSIRENRIGRLEERHNEAIERIRTWAEGVFESVTRPTRCRVLQARRLELEGLLHLGGAKSVGVIKDAELVGGNLDLSVLRANLIILKFVARLRSEEDIAEFKARYNVTDTIKLIGNTTELEEAKKELLTVLMEVIILATKRLVPLR